MSNTYHLTIDSDSPVSIGIIAELAQIELNEGRVFVDPETLSAFLAIIRDGLRTKSDGDSDLEWTYITGAGPLAQGYDWFKVASLANEISVIINKQVEQNKKKRVVEQCQQESMQSQK